MGAILWELPHGIGLRGRGERGGRRGGRRKGEDEQGGESYWKIQEEIVVGIGVRDFKSLRAILSILLCEVMDVIVGGNVW